MINIQGCESKLGSRFTLAPTSDLFYSAETLQIATNAKGTFEGTCNYVVLYVTEN